MELSEIREQSAKAAEQVCEAAKLKIGDLFVVGCSSSEILGEKIGTHSSVEVAEAVFEGIHSVLHEHGVEVKGKKLVVMGAGGAATAICMQTALDGAAEIAIFNRTGYDFYSNGELTVKKLAEAVPNCKVSIHPLQDKEALAEAVNRCDILVNATKVGMKPLEDQSLIDPSLFRPDLVVADTVYNPRETRMIQEAKAAGCKIAVGGIGMLLWQGVAAFKLYTGKDMPAQEVLEKFFS